MPYPPLLSVRGHKHDPDRPYCNNVVLSYSVASFDLKAGIIVPISYPLRIIRPIIDHIAVPPLF
ncbi:hypothetical protein EMERY_38 [Brevibacillus phage Emery]|nr:hypothetical protein EMERY_38 [Brevibacillus phage Emery]